MFSRVSERRMLSVRSLLLVGWLVLIASLFWDPFSITLTEPDKLDSPFRVDDHIVNIQGEKLVATPYAMGTRIFWTMLVPIVPLFLMVFGHEAWRRVCPLSLASQIPGYLGIRRFSSKLERRTGLIKRKIPLISPNGWIARNSWYIQFGMLFTGITARLLIINTDRTALAIALLTVICLAMLTGVLWGGKTWCNYFCPANIVQKIYTEPGGIMESAPHFSRPAVPQSMCRKPTPNGDVSACVACTANCGDIDLQRSYWNGILDPQRRNVYYMFLGLILGFYGFYYLYAGNWDYYFSGIWTHEEGAATRILGAGIFLNGQALPIPKLLSAPLILAFFCVTALLLGWGLENLYRRYCSRKENFSEKLIVHHCLCVAAWASINAFYLFGGRPNILLFPELVGRVIDIGIVALTTIWLRLALQQSPIRYQQESIASNLLGELKKMKVNVSKFLDGRKLESLKAEEVYLLTKVLPGFSQQQRLDAYRNILEEAVANGRTASAGSLKLLKDFRAQMNISEEEHETLLEQLGFTNMPGAGMPFITDEERQESLGHYRTILSNALMTRLEKGSSLQEVFADASFQATIQVLRQSLQINDEDHERVAQDLSSHVPVVSEGFDQMLECLFRQKSLRLCIESVVVSDPLGTALVDLLHGAMKAREQEIRVEALSILHNGSAEPDHLKFAKGLASLLGQELTHVLRQSVPRNPDISWREALDPKIFAILNGDADAEAAGYSQSAGQRWTHRKTVLLSLDTATNLRHMLEFKDPVIKAVGLMVFGYIDQKVARDTAEEIVGGLPNREHPLLVAAFEYMAGVASVSDVSAENASLRATIRVGGQSNQLFTSTKSHVTIGRSLDNDISISHPDIWAYHAAITLRHGEVRLVRLDEGKIYANGKQLVEESVVLKSKSIVTFGGVTNDAPHIEIECEDNSDMGNSLVVHPVMRLAMLTRNGYLAKLPLADLADIAMQSHAVRYVKSSKVEAKSGIYCHFLIQRGEIRFFDPRRMDFVPEVALGAGDFVEAELTYPGSPIVPEVTSDFAIVLQVPPTPEVIAASSRQGLNKASILARMSRQAQD
ncbi:FHA domain-containing protein [Rhizobium sp. NFACC06-2]|uniref:FHA domain-containing protein n=1 Tax=Rhizobium sp. NFACC06-2 TaxID=1566264 RepID=UPI00087668DE|nr:FHA domain-containing protein [Rhizobium sp. NFACC06-2]SCY90460.1 Polyferredoxin [Rhizobium sp. NFACC06-2]